MWNLYYLPLLFLSYAGIIRRRPPTLKASVSRFELYESEWTPYLFISQMKIRISVLLWLLLTTLILAAEEYNCDSPGRANFDDSKVSIRASDNVAKYLRGSKARTGSSASRHEQQHHPPPSCTNFAIKRQTALMKFSRFYESRVNVSHNPTLFSPLMRFPRTSTALFARRVRQPVQPIRARLPTGSHRPRVSMKSHPIRVKYFMQLYHAAILSAKESVRHG